MSSPKEQRCRERCYNYLLGEMSEKETQDFESQLIADLPLATLLIQQADLISGIGVSLQPTTAKPSLPTASSGLRLPHAHLVNRISVATFATFFISLTLAMGIGISDRYQSSQRVENCKVCLLAIQWAEASLQPKDETPGTSEFLIDDVRQMISNEKPFALSDAELFETDIMPIKQPDWLMEGLSVKQLQVHPSFQDNPYIKPTVISNASNDYPET